jgi:hypothetical protein
MQPGTKVLLASGYNLPQLAGRALVLFRRARSGMRVGRAELFYTILVRLQQAHHVVATWTR